MGVPNPASAVAAFAAFVRDRFTEVAPLWGRRADGELAVQDEHGTARHLAMVIIGAAAPFAPTAQARARLLRQAHASGLLSDREASAFGRAEQLAIAAAQDE